MSLPNQFKGAQFSLLQATVITYSDASMSPNVLAGPL